MEQDVDFTIEVGHAERHHVRFQWQQFGGLALIAVDGTEVLRERHIYGIKLTRRFQVTIGSSERHSILIEKTKPALFAGIRKQAVRAFVDGTLVGEY